MRRHRRGRGQQGSVTAFVVVLSFACLIAAGLALDGGRLVAARMVTTDVAGNAARAGAQHLVGIRGGQRSLDPGPARAAALQVLSAAGATGSVQVAGRSITVTAISEQSMLLLQLVGIGSRTVTATATALADDGS